MKDLAFLFAASGIIVLLVWAVLRVPEPEMAPTKCKTEDVTPTKGDKEE